MATNESTAKAPRLPLEMGVDYRRSYARQEEAGHLKNISLTGAFLKTANPTISIEDKLLITFSVGGRERKITANVVWKNDMGCGIQFQPFNNRDVQIVDDLIYFVESSRESRKSVLESIFKKVG